MDEHNRRLFSCLPNLTTDNSKQYLYSWCCCCCTAAVPGESCSIEKRDNAACAFVRSFVRQTRACGFFRDVRLSYDQAAPGASNTCKTRPPYLPCVRRHSSIGRLHAGLAESNKRGIPSTYTTHYVISSHSAWKNPCVSTTCSNGTSVLPCHQRITTTRKDRGGVEGGIDPSNMYDIYTHTRCFKTFNGAYNHNFTNRPLLDPEVAATKFRGRIVWDLSRHASKEHGG